MTDRSQNNVDMPPAAGTRCLPLTTADKATGSGHKSQHRRGSEVLRSPPRLTTTPMYTSRKRKLRAASPDALEHATRQEAPFTLRRDEGPHFGQTSLSVHGNASIQWSAQHATGLHSATSALKSRIEDVPPTAQRDLLPRASFDPIPVRIPPAAVSHLPNRASCSTQGECLLGLVICSYVHPDRHELLYVVLLDDGEELHIPCGQVEPVMLTAGIPSDNDNNTNNDMEGLHLLGHPSSQDIEDTNASNSEATAEVSVHRPWHGEGCWPPSGEDGTELGPLMQDLDFAFSKFGSTFSGVRPSSQELRPSTFPHAPEFSQRNPSLHSSTPTPSESLPLSARVHVPNLPTFNDLFRDVVVDHSTLTPPQLGAQGLCVSTGSAGHHWESPRDDIHWPSLRPQKPGIQAERHPLALPTVSSPSSRRRGGRGCGARTAKGTCGNAGDEDARPLQKQKGGKGVPSDISVPAPLQPLESAHAAQVYSRRKLRAPPAVPTPAAGRALNQPQGRQACRDTSHARASASARGTADFPRRGRVRATTSECVRRASAAAKAAAFAAAFGEETWTTERTTYVHDPVVFRGPSPGPNFAYRRMPTKLALFGRFWSEKTLETICEETNRYASEVDLETRLPMGGPRWWSLCPTEFRAFLGISLMMGIKRLPNHRAYWNKRFPFMFCQSIASTMSQARYEDITRCLHVSQDTELHAEVTNNTRSRVGKLGWLLTEMRGKFKQSWHLHQEVTVDECMVRYKGSYCPIRQYIPKKPTKWGIKIWMLADACKNYVYDFSMYTGSVRRATLAGCGGGGAKSGYDVVMLLMEGLHGRGHVVVTDNYFTSVKLVVDLAALGTYATGTVNSNRVGLPKALAQKRLFVNEPRGSLTWRMHNSATISCVVWVDRQPVLLLSSFYTPLPRVGEDWPTVPRWVAGEEQQIVTSPIHKGYTKYMRGVDVADQMRGAYSSQLRSHKWWHRLFFFLLDTSVVNSYIIYKAICERLVQKPVERIDFQLLLAEALCKPWQVRRGCVSRFRLALPAVHSLVRTASRKKCRFCFSSTRTNLSCLQCGGVHLHLGECFRRTHFSLRR